MLKFYYSLAPNPMKVALFLEEAGLDYDAIPVDTRKGEQFAPDFARLNPNNKVPAIVDGDATVFDSNAILLYLGEKTRPVHARHFGEGARRAAVLADIRRQRHRPLFRAGRPLPPLRPGAEGLRRHPLSVRGEAGITASSTPTSPTAPTCSGATYTIVDMAVWGWARMVPFIMGDDAWAGMPNLKRLFDEVSARPAAVRATALKDKHAFKTEVDAEAKSFMFRHLAA